MTWADCACCGAAGVIGDALLPDANDNAEFYDCRNY
jgi:hypothetical protein